MNATQYKTSDILRIEPLTIETRTGGSIKTTRVVTRDGRRFEFMARGMSRACALAQVNAQVAREFRG